MVAFPDGQTCVLSGKLFMWLSPHEPEIATLRMVDFAFDVHFSLDATSAMIGSGWPDVVFDNSAPLSPATLSVAVRFREGRLGSHDPVSGHLDLPIVLHIDYTPDVFLGSFDQDIELPLSTRGGRHPGVPDFPHLMELKGRVHYDTQGFLAWDGHRRLLEASFTGDIVPLPPAPAPMGTVPHVVGQTAEEGRAAVESAGFTAFLRGVVDHGCNAIGDVVGQSPSGGTPLPVGSSVDIRVGELPRHPCP